MLASYDVMIKVNQPQANIVQASKAVKLANLNMPAQIETSIPFTHE
jgi:hypothetical protein